MSLTHYHPPEWPLYTKVGRSPCGKRLNLCNWSTGLLMVNCKDCAKAIEAGTAETVKQGSAHRAKARSATPICPKTTAITSKDAAA